MKCVVDLCRREMTVSFGPYGCNMQKGKINFLESTKHGNYYCLLAIAKIWHQRLGHVNAACIQKLNLPYKFDEPREAYISYKQIATKHLLEHHEYKPLDMEYPDVMGPVSPETPMPL